MTAEHLTEAQARAIEWILRETLEIAWERDAEPKDAVSEATDLLLVAELLSHEELVQSATELRDQAQKRLDALPAPGALMPTFEAALKAWGEENREPLCSTGARRLWQARRAAFAAIWFVENVSEDASDRQDIFFKVCEIARMGS